MTKHSVVRTVLWCMLVGLLIFAMGCSDKKDSNNNANPDNNNNTDTEQNGDSDKVFDITWHGNFQIDSIQKDSYVEKELEKAFNVNIDYVNAKTDKLKLMAVSSTLPDVMRLAGPEEIQSLGNSGQLLELPESLLQEKMPNVVNSINNLNPGLWGMTKASGKNYAIPQYLTVVPWDGGMVWREDILKIAGVTKVPDTIAEYDAAFKAIKEHEKEIIAQTNPDLKNLYMFSGHDIEYQWNHFTWLFGAYGSMPISWQLDDQGKIIHGELLPGTKDALAKLQEWYDLGYIDPAFVTDKTEQYNAKLNIGTYVLDQSGFSSMVSKNPSDLEQTIPSTVLVNMPGPQGPNGDRGMWSWGKRQNYVALSSNLKDDPAKVDKILGMLEKIASDEDLYKLTQWGEEGRSYTMEDGLPVMPSEYSDGTTTEFAALGASGIFGPFGKTELVNKFMDPALVDIYNKMYTGKPDVIFGLPLPSSATTDQRVLDKWNETMIQIILSEAPLSKYDDYVKWFDENGGKQLTKEANDLYAGF